MIVELVQFTHPQAMTVDEARADAETTVPRWRGHPDLVRKLYLLGLDGREGAGLYFWPSVAAARGAHDAQWIANTERRTGQSVHISYYELLMTLDNQGPASDGASAQRALPLRSPVGPGESTPSPGEAAPPAFALATQNSSTGDKP